MLRFSGDGAGFDPADTQSRFAQPPVTPVRIKINSSMVSHVLCSVAVGGATVGRIDCVMFALLGDERAQCWNSSEWRSVKPVMLNRGPDSMRVLPGTCGELICRSRGLL